MNFNDVNNKHCFWCNRLLKEDHLYSGLICNQLIMVKFMPTTQNHFPHFVFRHYSRYGQWIDILTQNFLIRLEKTNEITEIFSIHNKSFSALAELSFIPQLEFADQQDLDNKIHTLLNFS